MGTTKMGLQEVVSPAAGGVMPARDFHGDVITLSVKYAF